MLNPSTFQLTGYYFNATTVQALKSIVRVGSYPCYVAVRHSCENVKKLVAALASPAETTYAGSTLTSNGTPGVAVPFAALRADAQFVLECIYLFNAEEVPPLARNRWFTYEITDFVPAKQGEGIYVKLPLSIAPPWEALPPSYISCQALPGRLALLQQVLKSDVPLDPVTLLMEDCPPQNRLHQAATLADLAEGARDRLEGGEHHYWSCLYNANLKTHPLLQPFWRRFEMAQVGKL